MWRRKRKSPQNPDIVSGKVAEFVREIEIIDTATGAVVGTAPSMYVARNIVDRRQRETQRATQLRISKAY